MSSLQKNAVLINAYPNNEKKLKILETSVLTFKKLGLPIIVISGCDIPESVAKHIDYYIINREKLVLGKDYMHMCNRLNNYYNNLSSLSFKLNSDLVFIYSTNHNPTIARNTKLVMEFAKSLGITNVFYTEDDNIFTEKTFDSIKTHLEMLNRDECKLISTWGTMYDSLTPLLFSCFFYTNIDFFLEHFKIPTQIEQWYDPDTIKKYKLYRAYEESLYCCFEPVRHLTYNYLTEYHKLVDDNAVNMNLASRYEELDWRCNTMFNVFKHFTSDKIFFVAYNFAIQSIKEPDLKVKIEIDGRTILDKIMERGAWFFIEVPMGSKIKLTFNDNKVKYIDVSNIEEIQNNGVYLTL